MHFTMSIKIIDCIRNVTSKQEIFYERKNRKLKQRISISTHKTLFKINEYEQENLHSVLLFKSRVKLAFLELQ